MANVYQTGNQKLYFNVQTIQWPKDIKGVIRIRKSKKNRQKEKVQKNKQRSKKHKTKDHVT